MPAAIAALLLVVIVAGRCGAGPADRSALVDAGGVLRWAETGGEAALFGVNYCVPFTVEYFPLRRTGLDLRAVIDQDMLHLARLGLNCLRMPVWDRQISDRDGNLLENEHLALLDHLFAEAKRRGLYMVMTPTIWYPTDGPSPGFSTACTMEQLTTDRGAPRAAMRRYLLQFARHRNPETGLSYADDPAALAFELINEPMYPPGTTDAQVTELIDDLTGALRQAGVAKPVFYNGWAGHAGAVAASRADGMTFGWYPTGLASGAMITTNALPLVSRFADMEEAKLAGKARGLYEFDAADIPWGYVYPAMARAMRAGGAQFANQFQYDAWPLASSNVAWQTHYLSLLYTPGKAISLMIAAEAFRRLPRLATPAAGTRFGPFRVDYAGRMSEMATTREFLYSGATATVPPAPGRLVRVAGVGRSAVAAWEGNGAYFLDRCAPGVWRMEAYPDVVWLADPFARHSEADETARLIHAERRMWLRLPDLGGAFRVTRLAGSGPAGGRALRGAFVAGPGVYILSRPGATVPPGVSAEYFAPPAMGGPVRLWHAPPGEATGGEALPVQATCTDDGARLAIRYRSAGGWRQSPMWRTGPYAFRGEIPASSVRPGGLEYALTVRGRDGGGRQAAVGSAGSVTLFGLAAPPEGAPRAKAWGAPGAAVTARLTGGGMWLRAEGLDAGADSGAECRVELARAAAAAGMTTVRVRIRALEPATTACQITLIQSDGATYASSVRLSTSWREADLPVGEFWPCWQTMGGRLEPTRVQGLSVALGRWQLGGVVARPQGVEVAWVRFAAEPAVWRAMVRRAGPPVALLRPAEVARRLTTYPKAATLAVAGPDGAEALEMASAHFDGPPDCAVISWEMPPPGLAMRRALAGCDTLRIRLRSRTPEAARVLQVGLTEVDGAPWGVDVPIAAGWRTVDVPLRRLRFFGHWARPAGRGGVGDRLRPERLSRVTLAYGAWQDPGRAGEPHIIQVASMDLVRVGTPGRERGRR